MASRSPLIRGLALVTLVVIGLGSALVVSELVARPIWRHKYGQWLERQLHGWDHLDRRRQLILPNPNTTVTLDSYRSGLVEHGKTLGLKVLDRQAGDSGAGASRVLFRVNALGFRGPEVRQPKPAGVFRILSLGDSFTWGPPDDCHAYPRVMERVLNRSTGGQTQFEVVNAAVYGYNLDRVLARLDEYLAVEPDLVTIYLGWNRTIGRADPALDRYLYQRSVLYRLVYHFLINRVDTGLAPDVPRPAYYDEQEADLARYRSYGFAPDIAELNQLVDRITQHRPGTRVVVITLAGLFDSRVTPDARALQIAYPIASTRNLYAYSILTRRYNEELRAFAARKPIDLVDFEAFAYRRFSPRSGYFEDSVHGTDSTYVITGTYLADEIAGLLRHPMQPGAEVLESSKPQRDDATGLPACYLR